jgi:altronate dehydratase
VYSLATENEVVVSSAQDIIALVNDDSNAKARQANAFLLAPLQDRVPAFLLAIGPVYKGQDNTHVRQWFNQALLYGGQTGVTVVGVGADGDSKVRKFYVDTFKRPRQEQNERITIAHESFEFSGVFEDIRGQSIPTLMFPD